VNRPLHIAGDLARQIEQHGVRAYPAECCGIIFGREEPARRVVESVRSTANSFDASERGRRFSIDPLELMRAERDAADAGLLVLGFYHSHPDHPARPSEFDRSRAWPFYSYVIVSIQSREAVDMTSWVLDPASGTFQRQGIVEEGST
jgi:proteasome lid subunit RPN8/RPN11